MSEEFDQTRPWSPVEVAVRVRELSARKDEAVLHLDEMGRAASHAKWLFENRKAQATLAAQGTNSEARKAQAMLATFEVAGEEKTVTRLGFEADVAANLFRNQHEIIRAIDNDLSICQTLIVDNRRVT
jgi:hypothetical protein